MQFVTSGRCFDWCVQHPVERSTSIQHAEPNQGGSAEVPKSYSGGGVAKGRTLSAAAIQANSPIEILCVWQGSIQAEARQVWTMIANYSELCNNGSWTEEICLLSSATIN